MKKTITLIGISIATVLILLSSCINITPININEQNYETMIKYVATLYNKGQYLSKDTVLSYLSDPYYTYPISVLNWYRYFAGIDSTPPSYKTISATVIEKFNNYVKNYTIDYWTADDNRVSTVNYNVESYPGYYDLLSKVTSIMTTKTNKFWIDVEKLYPTFTTEDATQLAKDIVGSAIKVSMSNLTFERAYDDKVFEKSVTIEKYIVKPELLLAFAMAETSFEPFAYKPEENSEGKIYSVSLGLSQILLNIGLIKDEVGLTDSDVSIPSGDYTFSILNKNYLSTDYKAEDLFNIQTADLFKGIFLQLLFDRVIRENWLSE